VPANFDNTLCITTAFTVAAQKIHKINTKENFSNIKIAKLRCSGIKLFYGIMAQLYRKHEIIVILNK